MAEYPSPHGDSSSDVSVDELNASIREQVHAAVSRSAQGVSCTAGPQPYSHCRFAGVLASEQSESEFLEPAQLEGRQSELERLEAERKSYQEQLQR